jgi:hypothetical protein
LRIAPCKAVAVSIVFQNLFHSTLKLLLYLHFSTKLRHDGHFLGNGVGLLVHVGQHRCQNADSP